MNLHNLLDPPPFLATIVHRLPHTELIIECVYSPQIVSFMMGEAVRGKIKGEGGAHAYFVVNNGKCGERW